jgi:hypothetical protein
LDMPVKTFNDARFVQGTRDLALLAVQLNV